MKRPFIVLAALLLIAAPAAAAPISFYSGDANTALVACNATLDPVYCGGATLTTFEPNPVWGDVNPFAGLATDTAQWISYDDTYSYSPPNLSPSQQYPGDASIWLTPENALATFTQTFVVGGSGLFNLWILADDTARVELSGPNGFSQVLFTGSTTNNTYCVAGEPGCVDPYMGIIRGLALGDFGTYTMTVYAYQLRGDGFGVQYAGNVTPEPASMLLLGTGLLGLAGAARRRLRK